MAERNEAIYLAKLASQAGRYNDFEESIRTACMNDANLSIMKRDILFMGYEKAVWNLREELDSLSSSLKQQDLNAEQLEVATKYQTKVEDELIEICNDFIDLIDHYLLPAACDAESIVFYRRMKGLQYFYMAWTKAGNERQQFAEKSHIAYEEASQTVSTRLSPANVERLRLEWRSVLHNQIFYEKQRALACAIAAVRTAIIDGQPAESLQYNSFTIILGLLKSIDDINNQIRKDETRTIPITGSGQEGGSERQRRRIN